MTEKIMGKYKTTKSSKASQENAVVVIHTEEIYFIYIYLQLYLFKFYKPNISYPETTSRSLSNKPVAMSRC